MQFCYNKNHNTEKVATKKSARQSSRSAGARKRGPLQAAISVPDVVLDGGPHGGSVLVCQPLDRDHVVVNAVALLGKFRVEIMERRAYAQPEDLNGCKKVWHAAQPVDGKMEFLVVVEGIAVALLLERKIDLFLNVQKRLDSPVGGVCRPLFGRQTLKREPHLGHFVKAGEIQMRHDHRLRSGHDERTFEDQPIDGLACRGRADPQRFRYCSNWQLPAGAVGPARKLLLQCFIDEVAKPALVPLQVGLTSGCVFTHISSPGIDTH